MLESLLFVNLDPQLLWNGIVVGSIFAVAALGLTLIFGVLDFILVCYGEYMAIGAYIALVAYVDFMLPIYAAVVVGMIGVAVLSYVLDKTVFQYFRKDDRSRVTLLIVSIGVSFILRHLMNIIWSPDPLFIKREGEAIQTGTEMMGIIFIPSQVATVLTSLAALGVAFAVLHRTDIGIAMRAASDNLDLVRVRGINTERLIIYVWIIGGAIAGLSGVMLGIDSQVRPLMGFFAIILVFGAVIAGGIGDPVGAVAGGYLMGIVREGSIALGVPANYKLAIAFLVFVAILIFRPDGIFGTSTRA